MVERTLATHNNPYEPPTELVKLAESTSDARRRAVWNVRRALMLLIVPALYNLVCFVFAMGAMGQNPNTHPFPPLYHYLNIAGVLGIAVGVWFFGLALLEQVTIAIHALTSLRSPLEDWFSILYSAILRAPVLAFLGAVLWLFWIVAFYHYDANFYILSIPIGIAANVLAARFYLPIFYGWFKLTRSASH